MGQRGFLTGATAVVTALALASGVVLAHGAEAVEVSPPVPVPSKFVGGYLEAYSPLLPRDVPASYDLLFYAFAFVDPYGRAYIEMQQDRSALTADIKARKAQGKPTILSIGGAGGARSGLAPGAHATAFVSTIKPLIDEFGFSGIDWDLETGIAGGISVDGVVSISRQLKAHYGPNFAITLAPYGNPELVATYKAIAAQIKDILTFVGFQYYNNTVAPTAAYVEQVMKDWQLTTGIRADQWSLGFLHVDDWLGVTTPFESMASIYTTINSRYPGVRGAWTWGINEKDRPFNYRFASTMRPVVHITPPTTTTTTSTTTSTTSTTARPSVTTSTTSWTPPITTTTTTTTVGVKKAKPTRWRR